MYRLLSMDRRILILVSVLVLIAFAVLWFKVHVLKFSLLPSPETELWLLECRVKFETPGGPVKASISMPNEVPGYFLTGVSTTPGFRFESEDRDDRLVATWSGIAEGGAHTILYQMRLIPDRYAGLIADSIDPLRKPLWSDAAAAAAAVSFLKSVDPDGRAKPEVLIPNVLKQLHNRNLPSVRTLLPENRLGAPFVRVAEKLLAMMAGESEIFQVRLKPELEERGSVRNLNATRPARSREVFAKVSKTENTKSVVASCRRGGDEKKYTIGAGSAQKIIDERKKMRYNTICAEKSAQTLRIRRYAE